MNKRKETRVKIQPWVGANRPSNNWALVNRHSGFCACAYAGGFLVGSGGGKSFTSHNGFLSSSSSSSLLLFTLSFLCKQVASTAQSLVVMGSVQQTLQQNVDEPFPRKRKKKDSGTPVGKNVVVLKSCNVTLRNNFVFMPNTIEMAQLKKKEEGQFLKNVQISSQMSQKDIRELLISSFPYLGDQR